MLLGVAVFFIGYFFGFAKYSYNIIDTGIMIAARNRSAISVYPIEAKLMTAKPANAPARINRALAM